MNLSRRGWILVWLALHAVAKVAGALAEIVSRHAWPEPDEDEGDE